MEGTTKIEKGYVCNTLVVDNVRGNVSYCHCLKCKANYTKPVYDTMIYKNSTILDGSATCRVCDIMKTRPFIEARRCNNAWTEAVLNSIKWDEGNLTAISTIGTPIAIQKGGLDIRQYNQYSYKQTVGDGIFLGVFAKVSGVSPTTGLRVGKSEAIACVQCRYCGNKFFIKNPDKFVCPCCSDFRNSRDERKSINSEKKKAKLQEKNTKKMLPHKKGWLEKAREGSMLDTQISEIKSANPDYDCVDVTRQGSIVYTLVCKKCGYEHKLLSKTKTIASCKFCDTRKVNEFGRLFQNHIGLVKNSLQVISQDKDRLECTVECIHCKRQHTIQLYDFLEGRYWCDCRGAAKSFADCYCDNPSCGALLPDITADEYFGGKDLLCPECKKDVRSAYAIQSMTADYGATMRRKIGLAEKEFGDNNRKVRLDYSNDILIKEKEPLYIGTDELAYYRCLCKEHNKALLLSEEEILNYGRDGVGHYACMDMRHRTVPYPDSKSLKI